MIINKKAFSLVEILIVIAIIALLSAIAIPNLIRSRVQANDAGAKAALKSISTALENYAAINSVYPTNTASLIGENPPYLQVDYFSGSHYGFTYSSTLTEYTYSVTATPLDANRGSGVFNISTGAVLSEL